MNELKHRIENLIHNYYYLIYKYDYLIFSYVLFFIFIIYFGIYSTTTSPNALDGSTQWRGYCPYEIYTIYDVETGVYYAVTEKGGITPMYTIEGEVKLVDQGNEYVIHKNLGSPHAQE